MDLRILTLKRKNLSNFHLDRLLHLRFPSFSFETKTNLPQNQSITFFHSDFLKTIENPIHNQRNDFFSISKNQQILGSILFQPVSKRNYNNLDLLPNLKLCIHYYQLFKYLYLFIQEVDSKFRYYLFHKHKK